MAGNGSSTSYTCNEYREEMILLALEQRLGRPDLSDSEKKRIETEIERLKSEMGLA